MKMAIKRLTKEHPEQYLLLLMGKFCLEARLIFQWILTVADVPKESGVSKQKNNQQTIIEIKMTMKNR